MQINTDTTNQNNFLLNTNNNQEETKNKDNSFLSMMQKDEPTEIEQTKTTEQLVADIKSVIRTGMTEDEIKLLEKMMELIQKEMNEKNPDKKKISEMMDEVENLIAQFKKAITGEAVEESDEIKKDDTNKGSLDIQTRFENITEDIKELKKEVISSTGSKQLYNSSELLAEIKKFQK